MRSVIQKIDFRRGELSLTLWKQYIVHSPISLYFTVLGAKVSHNSFKTLIIDNFFRENPNLLDQLKSIFNENS